MDGTGSGRCPLTYIGNGVKLSGCATIVGWLEYFTQCNTAQSSRASTFHTLSWAKCDQSSLLLVAA